jgi:hypothetical protein
MAPDRSSKEVGPGERVCLRQTWQRQNKPEDKGVRWPAVQWKLPGVTQGQTAHLFHFPSSHTQQHLRRLFSFNNLPPSSTHVPTPSHPHSCPHPFPPPPPGIQTLPHLSVGGSSPLSSLELISEEDIHWPLPTKIFMGTQKPREAQ